MKARINYKSKKTIMIIAAIIVLLCVAIAGTIAYVKDKNESTAATENPNAAQSENVEQESQTEAGQDSNNNGQNANADSNDSNAGANANNNADASNANANNNANNNPNTSSTTNSRNNGSTNNNTNGTTNTPSNGYGYTQTTIIPGTQEILVSEDTEIGWAPIIVNAKMPATGIYKPELKISKIGFVNGDKNQTAAQKGEIITYTIRVENTSDIETKNIFVYDKVPEGTTLVEDSIDNNGKNNNNKIEWKIESIKPNESTYVSFKALVSDDSFDVIKNKATVDSNPTEEVKTPIIKTEKVAKVVSKDSDGKEVLLDRDAKVGETLRYIISAKNNSEVDGQTVITDSIPENTELVEGTISEGGSVTDRKITWSNVKVEAGKTAEVSFDVKISDTKESIKNKATIGNTPTDDVETKVANISTEKTSKKINKDGVELKSDENLHELDFIEYSLKATNNGNGEGSVIIKDTIPSGTKLEGNISLTGDDKNYSEKELNDGIEVKLESNETKTITFRVRVQPFTDITKNVEMVNGAATLKIRNAEAKQDDKTIPPTEDIVEKEYTSLAGTKTWIDPAGTEHKDITINLLRDNKEIDSITLKNGESTYNFERLDKFAEDGHEYVYTVKEDSIDGYTPRYDENNITNVIDQDSTVKVEGTKTWVDPEGTNHPEITMKLLRDKKIIASRTLTNG